MSIYWLFLIIGIAGFNILFFVKLRIDKNGNSAKLLPIVWVIIFSAFIGARMVSFFDYYLGQGIEIHEIDFFLNNAGVQWSGALLFSLITITIAKKNDPITLNDEINDNIAYFVSISLVFGVLGCHISGHGCYGHETDLFLGVKYSFGRVPLPFKVHPTPLYFSFLHLMIFAILTVRKKLKIAPSYIFWEFIIYSSIGLFSYEFFKVREFYLLKLTLGQFIYLSLLIWATYNRYQVRLVKY